jgi:hypothetical protein
VVLNFLCLFDSLGALLRNLIVDLFHHLGVPLDFAGGKLSPVLQQLRFFNKLFVGVKDGIHL